MSVRLAVYAADLVAARPLVDKLAEHGLTARVDVASAVRFDPAVRRGGLDLVVNLVGAGAPSLASFTAEYLAYLADIEVPVVNGLDAFVVTTSLARQLALLDHLGVHHPAARVVADLAQVPAAAAELGSDLDDLVVHPGPPPVVQVTPPADERVRCAYVGGRFLAAHVGDEAVRVDAGVQQLGEQVVRTGSIEFGGVSFAVDPASGVPTCVGIDGAVGGAPGELEKLVAYVRYRAGLAPLS